jgi:tetratricopeptide (TPR) repeat protein
MPPVSGAADGVPLTLTEPGPPESWPIGLLVPSGRTPWGCLFFILLGATFLLWLVSVRLASILGLVGLIAYWMAYNHPRRAGGEAVARTLSLLGAREGAQAWEALEPALAQSPDDEGLQYLAAMVALLDGRSARALEHLDEARPGLSHFAEWHHLRGRCLRDLGRPGEAGPAYQRALEYPAYPSRNLLIQEAQAFFAAQGDHAALAALAALIGDELRPGAEATQQAFKSGLARLGEGPPSGD